MVARLYKFLKSADVHYYMDEQTIRLGRFSYYRRLFEQSGDAWIGDGEEGRSTMRIDHMHAANPDVRFVQAAARVGIGIGNSKNVTISNMTSHVDFDGFLFCASYGELRDLRRVMCEKSPQNRDPYDACLEITNPDRLYKLLRDAKYTDPVNKMRLTRFKQVEYRDSPLDALRFDHSPLLKRTMFSPQREARMLAFPLARVPSNVEFATAAIVGLRRCFKRAI